MRTHYENAARLYRLYGRLRKDGRVILCGQQAGVLYPGGTARVSGSPCRGLVLVTADPVDVVAAWLARQS